MSSSDTGKQLDDKCLGIILVVKKLTVKIMMINHSFITDIPLKHVEHVDETKAAYSIFGESCTQTRIRKSHLGWQFQHHQQRRPVRQFGATRPNIPGSFRTQSPFWRRLGTSWTKRTMTSTSSIQQQVTVRKLASVSSRRTSTSQGSSVVPPVFGMVDIALLASWDMEIPS